jgi:hypothetical protein
LLKKIAFKRYIIVRRLELSLIEIKTFLNNNLNSNTNTKKNSFFLHVSDKSVLNNNALHKYLLYKYLFNTLNKNVFIMNKYLFYYASHLTFFFMNKFTQRNNLNLVFVSVVKKYFKIYFNNFFIKSNYNKFNENFSFYKQICYNSFLINDKIIINKQQKTNFLKKFKFRKIFNVFKLKFKNSQKLKYYSYLCLSRLIFQSLCRKNLTLKYKTHFVELRPHDILSSSLIRITRQSRFFALFEFFIFKTNVSHFKQPHVKLNPLFKFLLDTGNFVFNSSLVKNIVPKKIPKKNLKKLFIKNKKKITHFFSSQYAFSLRNAKFFQQNKNKITYFKKNLFLNQNSFEFCLFTFNNNLFFKYFYFVNKIKHTQFKLSPFFLSHVFKFFEIYELNTKHLLLTRNNVLPTSNFLYNVKKVVFKLFNYQKFNLSITPFYSNTLIRFLENMSGKKIIIKIYNFVTHVLSEYEKTLCAM